jgi:hypothetical protein
MKKIRLVFVAVMMLAVLGCDNEIKALKDPPLALTFRSGLLSKLVMQINNLSTSEGVEVYVYVADAEKSVRSGNVVVPANGKKEFGALEIAWDFKAGDRGFVNAVGCGRKIFFKISENGKFNRWLGHNDIPEVDVAAQVRARKEAEHAACLNSNIVQICENGRILFNAIYIANTNRLAKGQSSIWPKSIKANSVKDKLKELGGKVVLAILKEGNVENKPIDIAGRTFSTSEEYFRTLLAEGTAGASYVKNVDCAMVMCEASKKGMKTKWSIIADYSDDLNDNIPVLITANFPCEKLRSFWGGQESANEIIALDNVEGLGLWNEAFVAVYKNGMVKQFKASESTLANIYSGAFNTLTNGYNRRIAYITPSRVKFASGLLK